MRIHSTATLPFVAWLLVVLLYGALAGCSPDSQSTDAAKDAETHDNKVELVYVPWSSEKASSHVVQAVIEQELGLECSLQPLTLIAMWESIAAGDKDGMVAGWLPTLQARFLQKFQSEVRDLGPNLQGTMIGLVVPEYVDVESIAGLSCCAEKFDNRIIGIDPHAGIMQKSEEAIAEYNLQGFQLISGSESTMLSALEKAIEKQEWIVVTGWTPHWKFAKFDLKYLQDPKGVFGAQERIKTIVRKGLQEEMPDVYSFLDRFYWEPEDMEKVMLAAQAEDTSYKQAAQQWVKNNQDKVQDWITHQDD
ncbi:MAG: glycine betaine ABC transporter substrate-binding protein [Desulfohalobiaceae bacterium]